MIEELFKRPDLILGGCLGYLGLLGIAVWLGRRTPHSKNPDVSGLSVEGSTIVTLLRPGDHATFFDNQGKLVNVFVDSTGRIVTDNCPNPQRYLELRTEDNKPVKIISGPEPSTPVAGYRRIQIQGAPPIDVPIHKGETATLKGQIHHIAPN